MYSYYCFTGIASLLIGLQLIIPTVLPGNAELGLPNKISSNSSFVTSNSNSSAKLAPINQSMQSFIPPDNGGPDITRGCGTR